MKKIFDASHTTLNAIVFPADTQLYETAKQYVAEQCVDTLGYVGQESFSRALRHYGLENADKETMLDIATELSSYAERSSF